MQQVTVAQGGRIVIPAKIRKQLDLSEGDKLECEVEDGALVMMTRRQRMQRAKNNFQQHFPPHQGRSLAEELIQERREAARHE